MSYAAQAQADRDEAIELTRQDLRSERLQLARGLPLYLRALPGWLTILIQLLPIILQLFQGNLFSVTSRRLRANPSPEFAAGYQAALADRAREDRVLLGLPPRA